MKAKDTEDTHTHTEKPLQAKPICFVMATLVTSSWSVSDDIIIKRGQGYRLGTQSELQDYREFYLRVKCS